MKFFFNFFFLKFLAEEPKLNVVEDDGEGEWVTVSKKQKSGSNKKKTTNDDYLELF